MAVSYNRELGVYQVNGRGAYASQAEAEAADSAGPAPVPENGTFDEFSFNPGGSQVTASAPDAPLVDPAVANQRRLRASATRTANLNRQVDPNASVYVDPAAQELAFQSGNIGGASGAYNGYSPTTKGILDTPGGQELLGTPEARAGIIASRNTPLTPDEQAAAADAPTGADANPPPPTPTPNQNAASTDTRLPSALDDLRDGASTADSLAARAQQQQALTMQSDLLTKILGFDPNNYAKQFADESLARTTALARSGGGSAASRSANIQAALDKAPEIFAEGQRQASTLENQRLNAAQAAVGKFGDLAYGVRGQDIDQQRVTNAAATDYVNALLTKDEQNDTYTVGILNAAMNGFIAVIQNNLNWAQLSETERHNLIDEELRSRGLDNQWEEIKKKYPEKKWYEKAFEIGSKAAGLVSGIKGIL